MSKQVETDKQRRKSADHLRKYQFKKGHSGNPKGRPEKARCIPDILQKIGSEKLGGVALELVKRYFPKAARNWTFEEAALRMTYLHALRGKSWAVQFIAERTEGKVVQPVDINPYKGVQIPELQELSIDELRKIAFGEN